MGLLHRRAFIGGLLATLALHHIPPVRAQADIGPVTSPLARLLEVLPDRDASSDGGSAFPAFVFVDGAHPGWQAHNAVESRVFQPDTPWVDPADWEGLVGIPADAVRASLFQPQPEGALRIVRGAFDAGQVEHIREAFAGNGYEVVDPAAPFLELRRVTPAGELQHRFPTIDGISAGWYDTVAFLDNELLVIASTPELAQMARDAQAKRIPYMTFGPGIDGIRRLEPAAVYEAVIVPGTYTPASDGGPHPLSVGVLTSFPDRTSGFLPGISGAFPIWTVIATLSGREPGRLVTIVDATAWAEAVQAGFDDAVSIRTGAPFADLMTLTDISTDLGTVVIQFRPKSPIKGYYELVDMALNRDLGFLDPSGATAP